MVPTLCTIYPEDAGNLADKHGLQTCAVHADFLRDVVDDVVDDALRIVQGYLPVPVRVCCVPRRLQSII